MRHLRIPSSVPIGKISPSVMYAGQLGTYRLWGRVPVSLSPKEHIVLITGEFRWIHAGIEAQSLYPKADGYFMGSEISLSQERRRRRNIEASIVGSGSLQKLEVVRNNQTVYVLEGEGKDHLELHWVDEMPFEDVCSPPTQRSKTPFLFYYLRVYQTDGEMAWISPIWIS